MIIHEAQIEADGTYSGPLLRGPSVQIVAEIGVNHGGSGIQAINMAMKALTMGASAVKFQVFNSDRLYRKGTPGNEELAGLDLHEGIYKDIREMCDGLDKTMICTPFHVEDVATLNKVGVRTIKIASPDIHYEPLIKEAARAADTLIISTGAAEMADIEKAMDWAHSTEGLPEIVLLHCVSKYPTLPEECNLRMIQELQYRFQDHRIGWSDHTSGILVPMAAVYAGAKMIEKHFTTVRPCIDDPVSIEPDAFKDMCLGISRAESILYGDDQICYSISKQAKEAGSRDGDGFRKS